MVVSPEERKKNKSLIQFEGTREIVLQNVVPVVKEVKTKKREENRSLFAF